MKPPPIGDLVYKELFPTPRPTDPQSFSAFLTRNLIPEVRQETQSFYGHISTQEAKYPGLDYSNPTHRIRLGRFKWHNRLFEAFDSLNLTRSEIGNLTQWEGTLWAKEKFEKEHEMKIRDTSFDEIPVWSQDKTFESLDDGEDETTSDDKTDDGNQPAPGSTHSPARPRIGMEPSENDVWEQWLKDAIEFGQVDGLDPQNHLAGGTVMPTSLIPAAIVYAARASQWDSIPEFLHPMLRRTLEEERTPTTRRYSDARSAAADARADYNASIGNPEGAPTIDYRVWAPSETDSLEPVSMLTAEYHPPVRQEWSTRRTHGALRLPAVSQTLSRSQEEDGSSLNS